MPSRVWKILALTFVVTVGCASVSAQECVIPTSDLIGVQMRDGACFGATKTFAKLMKIDASQCNPLPKKGDLLLGECVPRAPTPPPAETRSTEERLEALTEVVRELKSEIDALRTEMSIQSNETASDFERIYSRIGR